MTNKRITPPAAEQESADLSGPALDEANAALNAAPRAALLELAMRAAELEYMRTRDQAAYDRNRAFAFAAYDAASPLH